MAQDSDHKFRYLLPPGSDFKFVAKFRIWLVMSVLLMAAAIGALFVNKSVRGDYMNWTIDFKGGTEVIYAFKDKAHAGAYLKLDPAAVRGALKSSGEQGFDVSEISWSESTDKGDVTVTGVMLRTPRFSSVSPAQAQQAADAFLAAFKDKGVEKASWSGERLFVRSKQAIANDATATAVFQGAGLELKPWAPDEAEANAHPDQGTGEYSSVFAIAGLDKHLGQVLEKLDPDAEVHVVQSYGVGAKAGDKLRNDAIKSMVFALLLIMLYLAFRFDIRYAPGAVFATLHDAVMVVGVFAVTWEEVSLTSVAAILTVIGYSVNDTVIIFDRIRENQVKLKDKKLERIIDISINETLVRSIMSSLTVFAVTLLMNIFGDGLIRNFAFAMNIGVVVGTYSSIFLASPVFLWISKTWYSGPPSARATQAAAVAAEP